MPEGFLISRSFMYVNNKSLFRLESCYSAMTDLLIAFSESEEVFLIKKKCL